LLLLRAGEAERVQRVGALRSELGAARERLVRALPLLDPALADPEPVPELVIVGKEGRGAAVEVRGALVHVARGVRVAALAQRLGVLRLLRDDLLEGLAGGLVLADEVLRVAAPVPR